MAGVLLIVVSVVLGANLLASADRGNQWLSVTRALPAGHALVIGDLAPVKARLAPTVRGHYFTASASRLVGKQLRRPVSAGELLSDSAVASGAGRASRVVPVVVKSGRLPSLSAGDRVDVYVLSATPAQKGAGTEVRVLHDVEFVAEDVLNTGEFSVQLRVAPGDAIAAVAASQSERVDVVRIDRDGGSSPGEAGPSRAPAYEGG